MTTVLEQLKRVTTVVADTGDFIVMRKFLPTDATTNPSLILQASKMDEYSVLIDEAIAFAKAQTSGSSKKGACLEATMDRLFVVFGKKILEIVPGRVSTEVDARLSFDTEASIKKAISLISQYEAEGIPKERVLIKLASTWESIQAARILESEHGIHCNMTLLFGYEQSIACAQAKVTLISPFVGRIMDWYLKNSDKKAYDRNDDPGVKVMGASFRNTEQIKGLLGCDLLTISPGLLKQLSEDQESIPVVLSAEKAAQQSIDEIVVDEKTFRWALNEDAMATEKLAEGIRNFAKDARLLEELIKKRL